MDAEDRIDDLLTRVAEVCRLYWAKQDHPGADAREEETERDGCRINYVRVSYGDNYFTEHAIVGTHDGPVDADTVARFARFFDEHDEVRSPRELVFRGEQPGHAIIEAARDHRIRVRSFTGYQDTLWNYSSYLREQAERLLKDAAYPLDRHVDKRWALLGKEPGEANAAAQVLDWLDTEEPRFVLVLGDFGTGKTFLIRFLTRELATQPDRIPVLVTMRDLEKGRRLDELIAQHMARHNPRESFHAPSFRYLLREGRIVLLFDGFDELAQRPTYDRVKQHFETLRQAAEGVAKVVVTSRSQHFATDRDVLNELGRDARQLPGARILRLFPLDNGQRRDLVTKTLDADAGTFLRDLETVPNLPELTSNPRMLTFLMSRRDGLARLISTGSETEPMTAGRLYETLLTDWLEHEEHRQSAPGGAEPLSAIRRRDALRKLAVFLWRTGRASVPLTELGEFAEGITDLAAWQTQPGEATHVIGSGTVLVRDDDEFEFIHQSVLEWFVADELREKLESDPEGAHQLLAENPLTVPTADFLRDLAGVEPLARWALRVALDGTEPGSWAKANASLILQRTKTHLGGIANYEGQDLRGQDLTGQDLTGAQLSGALLDGAVLPAALSGADLSGAQLPAARLDGVDLFGADLRGANLRGARLLGADLRRAKLDGAVFDRAVLLGAKVDPAQLAAASTLGAALPGTVPTPEFEDRFLATGFATLANGTLIALGGADGTLRILDVSSRRTIRTLAGHPARIAALVGPRDGTWFATATRGGRITVWDLQTGSVQTTIAGGRGSVSLVADPKGQWLAGFAANADIQLWDPTTGRVIRTLPGTSAPATTLTTSSDGSWIAATRSDGTAEIWDPATGHPIRSFRFSKGKPGHPPVFLATACKEWLAITTPDGKLTNWDVRSGEPHWEYDIPNEKIRAVTSAPDAAWFAVRTDEYVTILDVNGTVITRSSWQGDESSRDMVASPGGEWLATTSAWGIALHFFDLADESTQRVHLGARIPVSTMRAHPHRSLLTVGERYSRLRNWDLVRQVMVREVSKTRGGWASITTDHRGDHMAAVDLSGPKTSDIHIWDITAGGNRIPTPRFKDATSAALSPNGRMLAVVEEGRSICLWKLDDTLGKDVKPLYTSSDRLVTYNFGPTSEWLLLINEAGEIVRVDTETGDVLCTWSVSPDRVLHWAAPADRRWAASAGQTQTVTLWDPLTGADLITFASNTGWATALATPPDGSWLAVAGRNRVIEVFDPLSGQVLRSLELRTGYATKLAASPDGRLLAAAGRRRAIEVWNIPTGQLQSVLTADSGGWAATMADGSFRLEGTPSDIWWTAGLCRFEADEIDEIAAYVPQLRRLS
ncbi:NACHT and WD40 repeat domain-containing protein [Amycolatopsis kentuckyensis]|uniref:NACHT and WD40 repeat domain-containing protein n=1 Tax=Amycolatopsis kentuckyensis TaxID=218823 RepID=UPI0035661469